MVGCTARCAKRTSRQHLDLQTVHCSRVHSKAWINCFFFKPNLQSVTPDGRQWKVASAFFKKTTATTVSAVGWHWWSHLNYTDWEEQLKDSQWWNMKKKSPRVFWASLTRFDRNRAVHLTAKIFGVRPDTWQPPLWSSARAAGLRIRRKDKTSGTNLTPLEERVVRVIIPKIGHLIEAISSQGSYSYQKILN